jgi:hypothetical protein
MLVLIPYYRFQNGDQMLKTELFTQGHSWYCENSIIADFYRELGTILSALHLLLHLIPQQPHFNLIL